MNRATRTLQELRAAYPETSFIEVPAGSLPRNHVAFFHTKDGFPYIPHSLSPCRYHGVKGGLVEVRFEGTPE